MFQYKIFDFQNPTYRHSKCNFKHTKYLRLCSVYTTCSNMELNPLCTYKYVNKSHPFHFFKKERPLTLISSSTLKGAYIFYWCLVIKLRSEIKFRAVDGRPYRYAIGPYKYLRPCKYF